ncbi:hypothetical protein FPV67DRAFT_1672675 [Lyophyllum atratum]|nr:hypothetical protein FPV67DRAFT_1672675 [Lyophyllum atratum]
MHSCLKIPEILCTIFQNVIDRQDWKAPFSGSATLLNLALTCKLFKEPALDVLWHTIQTLEPLIRCLPADAIRLTNSSRFQRLGDNPEPEDLERSSDPHIRLRLTRNISSSDGYTIQKYSSKVREVVVPIGWQLRPREHKHEPLLYHHLFSRLNNGPILPVVQRVTIDVYKFRDQAIYPRLIVGPQVNTVCISSDFLRHLSADDSDMPSDFPWGNVRAVILEHPLALQCFRIHAFRPENAYRIHTFVSPDIAKVICSHPSLKVIDVLSLDVDHATFAHLAGLPHVEELAITISTAELVLFLGQCSKPDCFPTMRKLHLHTPDLVTCTELIQPPDAFQHLQSLEITGAHGSVWNLKAFFDEIARHKTISQQLKKLRLSIPFFPWDPPRRTTPLIDLPTIEPLLSLSNLRDLSLYVDGRVDLDNSALARMGAAWPHLEVLELEERTFGTFPKITLTGLIPLLSSCSKLRDLALRIDATEKVSSFAQIGTLTPHLCLRDLQYCRSPIREPHHTAAFLTLLLPNLASLENNWIHYRNGEPGGFPESAAEERYMKSWDEVWELLGDAKSPSLKYS